MTKTRLKRVALATVAIASVALVILCIAYAIGRTYFSPKNNIETIFNINLPEQSTVVSYEEEESFHGDGCRYYEIEVEATSATSGTLFDERRYVSNSLSEQEKELITKCSTIFPRLTQAIQGDLLSDGFHTASSPIILYNATTKKYILLSFLT